MKLKLMRPRRTYLQRRGNRRIWTTIFVVRVAFPPKKVSNVNRNDKEKNKQTTQGTSSRLLKLTTAENWKTTSLVKFNAEKWLLLNSNTKNEVTMMVCKFCSQFKDKILSCKNFQPEWAGDGCKRLQLDAARGHAESDKHKKACDLFLKEEGEQHQ